VVLSVKGVRADDFERQQRLRAQQAQVVRLADAALASALDRELADARVRATAAGGGPVGSGEQSEATFFGVTAGGVVRFPKDRVFVGPVDAERPAATLDARTLSLAARAQAAEAQGRTADATALLAQLRGHRELTAWADLQLVLARSQTNAPPGRLADPGWAVSDDRSPAGIPVAIVASSMNELYPPLLRGRFGPLLRAVLANLRGGRWWLGIDQRRVYDADLRRWLREAGMNATELAEDDRLEQLSSISEAIRETLGDGGRVPPRAEFVESPGGPLLLVWARDSPAASTWSGVAVPAVRAAALVNAALDPVAAGAVLRAGGMPLRELPVNRAAGASFALASVPKWSLVFFDAEDPARKRERTVVNYARVALPVLVLTCGLLMTAWIVTREMALTRLKDTFVASVTHEFKSPITSIRLLMERIAAGRVEDARVRQQYCATIGAELDRLETLVDRLLETQKVDAGRPDYRFEPVAIDALAREVVDRMRPLAESRHITLELTADSELPRVMGDPDAISAAIRNLVDNAIKYSAGGKSVGVVVTRTEGWVHTIVEDEGVGVAAVDANRIFEPFFRSTQGDAANVRGTGLGLALVKAAAEAHGGSARVTSNGRRGSRFTFTLPASPTSLLASASRS
jgi:signal transduction histidine kinase